MKRSADRILTTHVGSLPTPRDLSSEAPDYNARLRSAVADAVRKRPTSAWTWSRESCV